MDYQQLWRQLARVYGEGEAKAIARMVYEVRYGLSFSDLLMGRDASVSQTDVEQIAERLMRQEPVQYVLGQADFCGRTLVVNSHVLIPRPETEELCRWIVSACADVRTGIGDDFQVLDVGTGSGCIAITLAAEIPMAKVSAWDVSGEALSVARENARRAKVDVSFHHVDVLNMPSARPDESVTPEYDLIVSNPPYVLDKERASMAPNVLEHEPHTALFVPDDDPLLFYRVIAAYGQEVLKKDGWLYFEINPLYGNVLREMLGAMSYHDIMMKTDQYGKQRMMRAQR